MDIAFPFVDVHIGPSGLWDMEEPFSESLWCGEGELEGGGDVDNFGAPTVGPNGLKVYHCLDAFIVVMGFHEYSCVVEMSTKEVGVSIDYFRQKKVYGESLLPSNGASNDTDCC